MIAVGKKETESTLIAEMTKLKDHSQKVETAII